MTLATVLSRDGKKGMRISTLGAHPQLHPCYTENRYYTVNVVHSHEDAARRQVVPTDYPLNCDAQAMASAVIDGQCSQSFSNASRATTSMQTRKVSRAMSVVSLAASTLGLGSLSFGLSVLAGVPSDSSGEGSFRVMRLNPQMATQN